MVQLGIDAVWPSRSNASSSVFLQTFLFYFFDIPFFDVAIITLHGGNSFLSKFYSVGNGVFPDCLSSMRKDGLGEVTLTRFMLEVAKSNPDFNELPTLFSGIATACKAIANLVKRSQLTGLTGHKLR